MLADADDDLEPSVGVDLECIGGEMPAVGRPRALERNTPDAAEPRTSGSAGSL